MDLQNKYQILASEFAKVRGQNTVLKKAVIDEQNKNQQLQVRHCSSLRKSFNQDRNVLFFFSRKISIKKIKIYDEMLKKSKHFHFSIRN